VVIGNQDAVPAIIPLLTNEKPDIIREACRTIAIIGNKDAIPAIEPLLTNSRSDIREEARKAITKLRAGH
jgi:HEAT repeat protein